MNSGRLNLCITTGSLFYSENNYRNCYFYSSADSLCCFVCQCDECRYWYGWEQNAVVCLTSIFNQELTEELFDWRSPEINGFVNVEKMAIAAEFGTLGVSDAASYDLIAGKAGFVFLWSASEGDMRMDTLNVIQFDLFAVCICQSPVMILTQYNVILFSKVLTIACF